ncbi:hypothetical protein PDIDSM_4917 [Penicillium digitatum]|nr:hypothetical protein PDIDSM_4917 [Penicillium digitatum]
MLESDANGDDRLLRGEIMTITDIMTTRLRSKSLGSHIVAPLLVLSLMGPRHVRVQEADLGGEILNMCASRLYDFMQKNTDVTQLLTRYWIGDTCGQTMEVSLIGGAFGLGYCSVVLSGNRNAALGMYDEEFTISWTSVVQETTFET